MSIQTLSIENDKSQIDKILSHEVTRPVQISYHGNIIGMITPQEGLDRDKEERADETINFLNKIRKQANLSQADVDRLLSEDG